RLPEYAARMKPVIPDYEWTTNGERVMKPVIPDYEWTTNGERVTTIILWISLWSGIGGRCLRGEAPHPEANNAELT
ncbi:hypothetical protein, partial [Serratia fonticola]